MPDDYSALKQAIEAAGFFTTFMPIKAPGDRMVCASHEYPASHERQGLHGNTFWVAKRGKEWFVATWAPIIYRVQARQRLTELCLCLLRREAGSDYREFDPAILREFSLLPVSAEEFERSPG